MVHHVGGNEYHWWPWKNQLTLINLIAVYGRKDNVVAYAWAKIEMDEAGPRVLGLASDDAIKVWLNGALIHENWITRQVHPDDDLVAADFWAGKNQLLIKAKSGQAFWGFACRLVDHNSLGGRLIPAVKQGNTALVKVCLSCGVDVNETGEYGFTALQLAQMRGHEALVQLLLDQGADPNIEMAEAGTPIGFLDRLWEALKENYLMMEYAGAFDDTWYEACETEIVDMTSLYQALPIMDRMLVRQLNDYHTSLYWEGKSNLVTPPIRVGLVEDQVVVLQCAEDHKMVRGDVVMEVDGIQAKDCFDHEFTQAFGATCYAKARSAGTAV